LLIELKKPRTYGFEYICPICHQGLNARTTLQKHFKEEMIRIFGVNSLSYSEWMKLMFFILCFDKPSELNGKISTLTRNEKSDDTLKIVKCRLCKVEIE
jgi:hypothetical protein